MGDDHNRFKYFGFYKAMFDFLVKAEPKESDMIVHPWNSSFEFPQIALDDLVLSPQEAAIYKLIMECTYNRSLGGLPTTYENKREIQEVENILNEVNEAYLEIIQLTGSSPDPYRSYNFHQVMPGVLTLILESAERLMEIKEELEASISGPSVT